NDLQRATQMATRMVCEFGMSDVLGARTYGDSGQPSPFNFREGGESARYSDATASVIDEEIKRIVDEAHERATKILLDNREVLVRVSEALIERETIDGNELDLLMKGETLPELPK